jgi:hypothetical protein
MPQQQTERLEAGIAMGIVVFFIGLAAAAILFMIMNQINPTVFDAAGAYTDATGEKGTSYLRQAWQWWPLYVLMVSFFGLIARATFQSEVP